MDPSTLRSSFELILSREPRLARRFYDRLFLEHPEAQALFVRRAREEQERIFGQALVVIVDRLDDSDALDRELRDLGAKHAALGVSEVMYGWFGQALLATFAEVAGDAWTPEVEAAWTDAYGAIVALVLDGA